ncbi:DUF664 domain-containing protein [Cryobacterium melibiosiphilum]|uniref:DUF664 domain-containing protein n=1 Tax=Cryobacterium melibiosiphilum TaxID=995039 RepID=A0A3A5MUG0_9MICO|nr:DUF664 domain-containing protein [Cryobacterium melibiosiphilum]RJT90853.1 DUF664 domain-containing protein [Cryobacterium melibiosiphilum]
MTATDLLLEAFGRLHDLVRGAVTDASIDTLTYRTDADANTIAWLVWHLSRVQDDHLAELAGTEQAWTRDGWAARFALPFDDDATGYGQTPDDVFAVRPDAELLAGYYDAVNADSLGYLATLTDTDLEEVIDRRWTPPVTRAARLVSVLGDVMQHAGQASFVRGIAERAAATSGR